MNDTRRFALLAVTTMMAVALPCVAQEQQSSQTTPAVTGSGSPGHIALWKSSSALTSSTIYATGGNIGIGTKTPVATLEVNGNAQVDGSFTLSGSILETGVGQLLWAGNNGRFNLSAGLGTLPSSTTGTYNTGVGDSALAANADGGNNTAVGYAALFGNTSGVSNTASGALASYSNTTGFSNTAIGSAALYSNTAGINNTAIGVAALSSTTTGTFNTATGTDALMSNTTGIGNVASGSGSLEYNTSGKFNTGSGYEALFSNSTGSNNIAVGYFAGYLVATTSNNIHIGNMGTDSDTGTIRIGTPFTAGCTGCQTSAYIAGIYGSSTGLANVPVAVDANGNLGTVLSSRRYKEDIHDMSDSSDGLMQLRPVTFRYKQPYQDGSKPVQYGLIAEEVADVYPDLVARSADGQIESVRYQLLDPMLLNELQKQHATIDAQKEQIRSLEERLARIEAMLAAGATGATGQ